MSNRTSNYFTYVPTLTQTPPEKGFSEGTFIHANEINGVNYASYNFVNSFVNSLISNSKLTDQKVYDWKGTNLSDLITQDIDSWIDNHSFTNVSLDENGSISIESNIDEYAKLNISKLEFSDRDGSSSLYSDKLVFVDTSNISSTLTNDELKFVSSNNMSAVYKKDGIVFNDSSTSYTITIDEQQIEFTDNEEDHYTSMNVNGFTANDNTIYTKLTSNGVVHHTTSDNTTLSGTKITNVRSGKTQTIELLPSALNITNVDLRAIQSYVKTYTKDSDIESSGEVITNFIKANPNLHVLGITIKYYSNSKYYYRNLQIIDMNYNNDIEYIYPQTTTGFINIVGNDINSTFIKGNCSSTNPAYKIIYFC